MNSRHILSILIALTCFLAISESADAMYHTRLGRFIQRDPTGYPDGMNAYAGYHVLYGRIDPYGLRLKVLEVSKTQLAMWIPNEDGDQVWRDSVSETGVMFSLRKRFEDTKKLVEYLETNTGKIQYNKALALNQVKFNGKAYTAPVDDYIKLLKRELESEWIYQLGYSRNENGKYIDYLQSLTNALTKMVNSNNQMNYDITLLAIHGTKNGKVVLFGKLFARKDIEPAIIAANAVKKESTFDIGSCYKDGKLKETIEIINPDLGNTNEDKCVFEYTPFKYKINKVKEQE